jgi:tetratricopeptide (TPR) repeat protein
MKHLFGMALGCALILALSGSSPAEQQKTTPVPAAFFTPANPPISRYVIDARISDGGTEISGRETISLENTGRDPLAVLAFDWNTGPQSSLEISIAGRKIFPPAGASLSPQKGPIFVSLPEPLAPGSVLELAVLFGMKTGASRNGGEYLSSAFSPRLWWDGLPGHDSYSVKLEVPPGVAVAASGRLDPKTGRYEASAVRTFGLYLAPGLKSASREVDGILIMTVFTDKGAKAAAICLETAADAVHFYKDWLGFYPFPFLNIIPGGSGRWGGYPVATGIVAIHGLETYVDGESPRHWQHITSHEIGHQYWGEWILDSDAPSWMWIAGGIFADTEFMIARGFDPARREGWMGNYIDAIPMYYDMTLDAPPDREDAVKYDFNNTVVHSKGPAVVFALDAVLGRDTFLRIYKRCLRDFGGKRFGWRDFRAVAEAESGQNLAWFFDAWVRSNQYLCYGIESRECKPDGMGAFTTVIRVKRLGPMSMPVPVQAVFEDGTMQTARTDRTKSVTALTFQSRSPLRDVVLDPEKKLARIDAPLPKISAAAAAKLAFGWEAGASPEVYAAMKSEAVKNAEIWFRLGVNLYGADRLTEAADCFGRVDVLKAEPLIKFGARGWLGILADLKGQRAAAIGHYQAALAIDPGRTIRHDQYKLAMNRAWLEERLKTPYARASRTAVPEHPTAAQLIEFVDGLDWSGEGETPLRVFQKTPGLVIADSDFWFKLGLLLYDGGYYREGLEGFTRTAALEKTGVTAFAARVWQGHLNDLLGDRAAALINYKEAQKLDPGVPMRHSQWGMTIDGAWVEERLASPFAGKKK